MKKESSLKFNKIDLLILTLILIIAFIFRLYKIDTPLADLHSWRQADTAAVARNYSRDGIDLLHPTFDDISSLQSGIENPKGYRYVEFPIYNAIVAAEYNLYNGLSITEYGRLTSAIFSLFIILSLYYIFLKESGRIGAITTAGIYAVFPFFVFFSRTVLPETTAVSCSILSLLFIYLFSKENRKRKYLFYLLSLIFFTSAILIKPTAIFYGFSIAYVFFMTYRFSVLKKISFYSFFFISIIPFVLWRIYILRYPAGIPPSDWLLTSVNTYEGLKNIFLRPAFFRWIFFERINIYMLGGYSTFLFILGIISKQKRLFLHSIIFSGFFYLFVFEGGNVQHEYYQIIMLPSVAAAVGMGTAYLTKNIKSFIHPAIAYLTLIIVFLLSFGFSYYNVKNYYYFPPELPGIAKIVNTLTTPDDRVVTDRSGDTTLLYLIDRKGSPAIYKDFDVLKELGYTDVVTLHKDLIEKLKTEKKYELLFENDQFALFKL